MNRFDRQVRWVAVLAVAAVTSACSDLSSTPPQTARFGSIVVEGKTTSATTVSATAKGIFFEASSASIPNSITAQTDACTIATVDTTTSEVLGQSRAGDALALQVGTQNITMNWVPVAFRYDTPTAFSYTSGATAQLTVPGNAAVFPASSVSVLLAEPLLAPPITVTVGQPLVVLWNGSTTGTSAVLMSLAYASSGSTFANQQVICQLRDDGRLDLPASQLTAFFASSIGTRKLTLTRFRTAEVGLDSRTLLHISSQVDTVVTLR